MLSLRGPQGLVHMCKGTIGLNLFFPDLIIMSRSTVAGSLGTFAACKLRDLRSFRLSQVLIVVVVVALDRHRWMLYFLVMDTYPRFLSGVLRRVEMVIED